MLRSTWFKILLLIVALLVAGAIFSYVRTGQTISLPPLADEAFLETGRLTRAGDGSNAWQFTYETPKKETVTAILNFSSGSHCVQFQKRDACDDSWFSEGDQVSIVGKQGTNGEVTVKDVLFLEPAR